MKRLRFRSYPLILCALALISMDVLAVNAFSGYNIVAIPILLTACLLWPARWEIRHLLFRNRMAIPIALAIIVSVVWLHWPLRLHYALIEPGLDRIALRVQNGEHVKTPLRAGLFTITKVESDPSWAGIVFLWRHTNPGKREGFLNDPRRRVHICTFSIFSLSKNWQYVWED